MSESQSRTLRPGSSGAPTQRPGPEVPVEPLPQDNPNHPHVFNEHWRTKWSWSKTFVVWFMVLGAMASCTALGGYLVLKYGNPLPGSPAPVAKIDDTGKTTDTKVKTVAEVTPEAVEEVKLDLAEPKKVSAEAGELLAKEGKTAKGSKAAKLTTLQQKKDALDEEMKVVEEAAKVTNEQRPKRAKALAAIKSVNGNTEGLEKNMELFRESNGKCMEAEAKLASSLAKIPSAKTELEGAIMNVKAPVTNEEVLGAVESQGDTLQSINQGVKEANNRLKGLQDTLDKPKTLPPPTVPKR